MQETFVLLMKKVEIQMECLSYRHRYGSAKGDSKFETIELLPEKQPTIKVPAIILDAEADGVEPFSGTGKDAGYFEGGY